MSLCLIFNELRLIEKLSFLSGPHVSNKKCKYVRMCKKKDNMCGNTDAIYPIQQINNGKTVQTLKLQALHTDCKTTKNFKKAFLELLNNVLKLRETVFLLMMFQRFNTTFLTLYDLCQSNCLLRCIRDTICDCYSRLFSRRNAIVNFNMFPIFSTKLI